MRLRTPRRWPFLLLAALMAAGCASSSRPSKYRKKRGCDCPRWNLAPAKAPHGAHAARFTVPPSC